MATTSNSAQRMLRSVGTQTKAAPVDGDMPSFMNVRQVAQYLQLNEKKVYALASEGKVPATKITGKWLFPRDLVDQWLVESSHGGILTDRLVVAGSDDPLLYRLVMRMANEMQADALVSYSCTGTQLGLSLLAKRRADVCAIHWGPADESALRHRALIQRYPEHHQWVIVRAFQRAQGLIVAPRILKEYGEDADRLLRADLRWAMRQQGSGSHRFLVEVLAQHEIRLADLKDSCQGFSERDAASRVSLGEADIAPGTRSAANEVGLGFCPIGWEAFDLVLNKRIYFRILFQRLMDALNAPDTVNLANSLSGYRLREAGRLIWPT